MQKSLPKELTSYDFLKTFAVVFMIVDHIGFYFFPEENWVRVFGRLCVPAWFFLIGYARSRDLGLRMWIGAFILICGDFVAGLHLFPVNILGTMIIIRLLINPLMERAMQGQSQFWAINTMLVLLAFPTNMFFEYGTLGLIMAILGYLARQRGELKAQYSDLLLLYLIFAFVSFVLIQTVMFDFTLPQFQVLGAGTFLVMGALYIFRPVIYPRLTALLTRPVVWLLQLTGRRTLEIYVAHLLLFKLLGLFLDPERFSLFDFEILYFEPEDIATPPEETPPG